MTARYGFPLLVMLGLLWFAVPSSTQAADRWAFGVNIGGVRPCAERVWVPGTYVMRTENVLVAPAHYESRWVPPVVQIRERSHHPPVTIVLREGYCEQVLVPARYELREVRQWIPGHWEVAPVAMHRPPVGPPVWARNDWRNDRCDDRHDRRDGPAGHASFNIRF